MVSPIRVLDESLVYSIARIAPEKFHELENFHFVHDLRAVFTNDNKFSFRVNTLTKEIKLPTVALEFLWCSCFSFYVIYQVYCRNANNRGIFELNSNERTQTALLLYRWAYAQLTRNIPEPWPEDLPMPDSSVNACEDIKVANELYLCSVAWIMHHEIGHIIFSHENNSLSHELSRQQERQADESSARWILDGVKDEAVLKKRGLGVAIAMLALTSQDILAGTFRETTHPKSFERLYYAITPYFDDPDHLVYAFCTVICHFSMALNGMQITKDDNATWRKNLESSFLLFNRLTIS